MHFPVSSAWPFKYWSILVYPYLKEKQQQKWDVLYTHYMNKEINQQVSEDFILWARIQHWIGKVAVANEPS